MTRSEMKTKAKESLKGNWGTAIGVFVVNAIIMAAAGACGGVGALILYGVMATGFNSIFIAIIRKKEVVFEKLFSGFSNFGTTCIAGILTELYIFLWSLLFVIPGIVKSFSYSMTFYILCDHPEMSAGDAITKSKEMMNGHKGELFVLYLSFIGWAILTALTCGLLSLYVQPYIEAAKAEFYENLKSKSEPAAETVGATAEA